MNKIAVQWLKEQVNLRLTSEMSPTFLELFDEAEKIQEQQMLEVAHERFYVYTDEATISVINNLFKEWFDKKYPNREK